MGIFPEIMRRKLFIGIGMDGEIATRLKRKLEPFLQLPVLWTSEENMHITLLFLGYVDDMRIPEIVRSLSEACEGMEPFDVELSKIALGPDADRPKTIWVEGEANELLKNLQRSIETALGSFAREKNAFRPHVTLGRIKRAKWNAIEKKPDIVQDIRLIVPVSTVTLFESVVDAGKRRYLLLEVAELG